MPTKTSYDLSPISNNEWSVKQRGHIEPCGSIRKLTHRTYGWNDSEGLHEYGDIHTAASQCIRYAKAR